MSYLLEQRQSDEFYIFQTNIWSAPDFNRLPRGSLISIDIEAWTAILSSLFSAIEPTFFEAGVFNYLGYSDSCVMTDFFTAFDTKIVSLQFHSIYQSPNLSQYPHVLGVDIFVCEEENDPSALARQIMLQDTDSTAFKVL